MDICLRVLKESNISRFDNNSVKNSVLNIAHITFRDCRVHIFSDDLSRNSCIRSGTMQQRPNQPDSRSQLIKLILSTAPDLLCQYLCQRYFVYFCITVIKRLQLTLNQRNTFDRFPRQQSMQISQQ